MPTGESAAPIRVGVLGAGRIGVIHAENLARRVSGATVTAIADVRTPQAEALARTLGVRHVFADYHAVIEHADVDAVAICTSSDTHYQIVMDTIASRKPIFCEKPVDLRLEKIHVIRDALARTGVPLMVAFQRRYDPGVIALRDRLLAGAIGRPHLLRMTTRDATPPSESFVATSGGLFVDMSVHDFDMARFLLDDEIVEVYAKGAVLTDPMFARHQDFDTCVVTLTCARGTLVVSDNSRHAVYGFDNRVEVFGSNGMLALPNRVLDPSVYSDVTGRHEARPPAGFAERYGEAYRLEMQAFIDALRQGTPMPVTVDDGLRGVEIAVAATQSARENRPVAMAVR